MLSQLVDRQVATLELSARQWRNCHEDVVQEAVVKLAGQLAMPADMVLALVANEIHK